jgi:sulfatase maturation enzyme AslB (radical SAM superfamily)
MMLTMSSGLHVVDPSLSAEAAPAARFFAFDTLWFQLTGTLCNIACRHCFITCGPKEDRVPMMSSLEVMRYLDEAAALGCREYYFTGGEPMMHPQFWELCAAVLERGPLTVLSNGLLVDDAAAERAAQMFARARYSFDLRISLDGMTAEENDPVRGKGTFLAITAAIRRLAERGLSPTLTVVEHSDGLLGAQARARFLEYTRSLGLGKPRVKFLPLLRIGREARRTHGYQADDDWHTRPISLEVEEQLVCSSSRLVTAQGVSTCPILLDAPGARLGKSLHESLHPIRLRWSACRTCVLDGLSCRT